MDAISRSSCGSSASFDSPPPPKRRRPAPTPADALPREDPQEARAPSLSKRALAARRQALAKLGAKEQEHFLLAKPFDPIPPEQILETCRSCRITLLDLEAMVLPRWNFNCVFPSRRAFVEYIGSSEPDLSLSSTESDRLPPEPQLMGTLCGLRFEAPGSLNCSSARWAELLCGPVLARLMTDSWPTEVFNEVDPAWSQEVFAALRRVVWAPELHWVFPRQCRKRLTFLSWLGRALGLSPTWNVAVLPFLSMELIAP